jgi:ABC-type glycerol-3-phosphate transport system substrate-binding protein
VKFAMTPAVQAQWQSDTGYYAIVKAAYNEAPAKEWATKYPPSSIFCVRARLREDAEHRAVGHSVLR